MCPQSLRSRPIFHHRRLAFPRSIRVLSLLPAADIENDLEVSLREVCLDQSLETRNGEDFEALSYVWGSRFGTEPLICDGKVMLITPNCEAALRYLRLIDKPRVLWVDAICIDQEAGKASVKERNVQVAMMGEIYTAASHTLCWFGEGNVFTAELMMLLEHIGNCPSKRGLKKFMRFEEKLRRKGQLDEESSSLDLVFCHPWHSRIWTVQEAVYSQRCSVVCGKAALSWESYSAAAKHLLFDNFIEQVDIQAHKSFIGIDVRNVLRDYLHRPSRKSGLATEDEEDERDRRVVFLSSCLTDVNQLQATEPRDKIYGLHSLYTALGIPLQGVDYELPISRVYELAAIAMIVWSGRLRVIGDAVRTAQNDSFPSWVPDWSDGQLKICAPLGTATTRDSRLTNTSASDINPSPGELHVRGKIIGVVAEWRCGTRIFPSHPRHCSLLPLSDKANDIIGDVETLRLWISKTMFFRELYSLLKNTPEYCQESEHEDILHDILKQDSYSEPNEVFFAWLDILQYPGTNYDLSVGEALFEKWKPQNTSRKRLWTQELTSSAVIIASLLSNSVRYHGDRYNGSPEILDMINEFSTNLHNKTLMLTKLHDNSSVVMGTALASVMTGDAVVLLQGADWPVVLRRKGAKWCLVGPAFVTGVMNGEAWPEESEAFEGLSTFILI